MCNDSKILTCNWKETLTYTYSHNFCLLPSWFRLEIRKREGKKSFQNVQTEHFLIRMVRRVSEDFLSVTLAKVGSRNQSYSDVSRRNQSTKSPRLCLRAQMISSKWSLPRYLTGLQTWRMRRKESTRTLLNRLLRRQVCVCHQLSVRPFTHDML